MSGTPKLAIIGTVRVAPEAIETARPAMAAMLEATRQEPGCVSYAFAEDVLEPGLIRISELWLSREDLAAHAASAHMAVWRGEIGKAGVLARDLQLFELASVEPL